MIGLSYSSTSTRDSSRIIPVDPLRCPSRPRAPLPFQVVIPKDVTYFATQEGVTLPSSLLRAHAPDQSPPLNFAFRYFERSLQVAVSPCRKLALPDIISTILAWLLRPLSRGVSSVLTRFFLENFGLAVGRKSSARQSSLQCNFNRG